VTSRSPAFTHMDALLKETTKLEKLSGKGKFYPGHEIVDSLLAALYEAKSQALSGNVNEQTLTQLSNLAEAKKKEIDDRQKEIYACLSRLGKSLDKVRYNIALAVSVLHDAEILEFNANVFKPILITRIHRSTGKNYCPSLSSNWSL
jgi:hypothetical protein